jgi:hypothetical protein
VRRALLALPILLAAGSALADGTPRAFVELFTSQGCASCPPADALIGELASQDDVLAVTMPVTLWDFLGWHDTLATDTLTKRQMAYSVARGDRDVYTPQAVVNGHTAVLGSDVAAIRAAITEDGDALTLPIDLGLANGVLTIAVGEAEVNARHATLWLLVVDEEVAVPVSAGENRGRNLVYHNVVRHMRPIGMWKGKPMSMELPLNDVERAADLGCVVIAQVDTFKGPGRVIGAAELDRIFPSRTIIATPSGN